VKLYLILGVVLACIWLWRANRHSDPKLRRQNSKPTAEPLDMVRCALCSVHVPASDVVKGKKGVYCGAEHRQRAEP
jgi:uncharacterized protein